MEALPLVANGKHANSEFGGVCTAIGFPARELHAVYAASSAKKSRPALV